MTARDGGAWKTERRSEIGMVARMKKVEPREERGVNTRRKGKARRARVRGGEGRELSIRFWRVLRLRVQKSGVRKLYEKLLVKELESTAVGERHQHGTDRRGPFLGPRTTTTALEARSARTH